MMSFRPAAPSDSAALLEWRNDPDSRAASLSQDLVQPPAHEEWFSRSLDSDHRWIFMVVDEETGERLGMCRFDEDDDGSAVEVSINLNPDWRGRGLANQVLSGGIDAFHSARPGRMVLTATIRSSNVASARVFRANGFSLISTAEGIDLYRRA